MARAWDLPVAAERILQQPGELGVAVRHVCATLGLVPKHTEGAAQQLHSVSTHSDSGILTNVRHARACSLALCGRKSDLFAKHTTISKQSDVRRECFGPVLSSYRWPHMHNHAAPADADPFSHNT